MGAEDLIESYIDDINTHLATIREVTKKVQNEKDSGRKANEAANADEAVQSIQSILDKKFTTRVIDRTGDRKDEFVKRRQDLEDSFDRLKKNLQEALKETTSSAPVVSRSEPKKQTQTQTEDPDVQARREEATRRRMAEAEESQRRKQIQESEHHESVKAVLNVQEDILESIARSKGINIETLKIADRVGQKLVEQTEQMERIQAKLDDLGDGLNRAAKEVSTVMRGVYTDKIILAVICCIVTIAILLLLVRIGYAIYQGVSGTKSLFPSPTGQKPATSSSVASLFKYNGGNVLWN